MPRYKGVDVNHFIDDLEAIHNLFQLPLWITEFAPQTHASSVADPTRFSQDQVDAFVVKATAFMEATLWVHRYAWHNSGVGTSALFNDLGELTATGHAYSKVAPPAASKS